MGKNVLIRLFSFAVIVSLISILPLSSATMLVTGGKDSALKPPSVSPVSTNTRALAVTGVKAAPINGILSIEIKNLPQIKPRYLRKSERDAARLERKRRRDYNEAIKENQRRSIEIQTPEVQERMKMNKKNADANYRAKRKENRARTRDAARKFN